jgi:spore photoproduct lyase
MCGCNVHGQWLNFYMRIKKKIFNYGEKFEILRKIPLFGLLTLPDREAIQDIAFRYRLTFQEFKNIVEVSRDLEQWQEQPLHQWWHALTTETITTKKQFMHRLHGYLAALKSGEKRYPPDFPGMAPDLPGQRVVLSDSDKALHGLCPVASEKTICCNLYTIDIVENCPFACSYCTIQTFYSRGFFFDKKAKEKLLAIKLDKNRFYHFGSGQASDSLVWGNRNGILDTLCQFAKKNQNILLELKTKSQNIDYFLQHKPPKNTVISWTLNTPTIIANEEHHTASLDARIDAAHQLVRRGIKVAFHFHPMVYYQNWHEAYTAIARTLINRFAPADVLFISFGSVTLIRPVLEKIRMLGFPTKITQMEMVPDPHGRYTYPDSIKTNMFHRLYQAFSPWHADVFFYLCMEKAVIWQQVFGFAYESNAQFEVAYGRQTMQKVI